VLDAARQPGGAAEEWQERRLNDGSRHRVYKRTYRYTTRFKAHDEYNEARIGDMVVIEETRPLSKEKRWKLVKILNRAVQTMPVEEAVAQLAPDLPEPGEADETETEDEE